jgi:hypothetical protein
MKSRIAGISMQIKAQREKEIERIDKKYKGLPNYEEVYCLLFGNK